MRTVFQKSVKGKLDGNVHVEDYHLATPRSIIIRGSRPTRAAAA
jgi:hypothetical protein